MNTGIDTRGVQKVQNMSLAISVLLMLLHLYAHYYPAYYHWGLASSFFDKFLFSIASTGLFRTSCTCRLLSLIFLIVAATGGRGRKEEKGPYIKSLSFLSIGLSLFLGSQYNPRNGIFGYNDEIAAVSMGCCAIGYLLTLHGVGSFFRALGNPFSQPPANTARPGFLQEERLILTDCSLNFPARYTYENKTRHCFINLINPRRGTLILGSPGCGKSWFIIEQAIHQLATKGTPLFVYDYKFDVLSRIVYQQYLQYKACYPPGTRFFCINFTDLDRSHRCNLLDPATLEHVSDAIGISRTILLSMNRTWVHKQGEFFVESPISFLAALIWYLRKYKQGVYCTLPHAIELAQVPYRKLLTLLYSEPELQSLINTFLIALENNNFELIDSQIASAKIPLGRLVSPDLYYILTGDDLNLDINNPKAPKLLCLGGSPTRQEALAPVLSLYIDRLCRITNQPGRTRCAIICDEFATVRAAGMLTTISTARSNNVIPIIAVQDLTQLRTQYSREEADQIMNITGNLISGQIGGETARWISERFPSTMQYKKSVSVNSSDTTFSKSEQTGSTMSPSTIATLSSGQFVGIVADDPDQRIELKAFHADIIRDPKGIGNPAFGAPPPLPRVRQVTSQLIQDNFNRIRQDIAELVQEESKRQLVDPHSALRKNL